MSRRVLVLVAVVVGLAVALPLLAVANHAYVSDDNDTRGLLDVRSARVNANQPPAWKVVTYPRWSVAEMWDAGYLTIRLDTFGSTRFDYYALVRSDGYKLVGELMRDRATKSDTRVAWLKAWHPDPRVAKVRIPLRKMEIGKNRNYYRWRVQTIFVTPSCPRTCLDNVPDRGAVTEQLPWATPTGSPTATPTVTATVTPTVTPTP